MGKEPRACQIAPEPALKEPLSAPKIYRTRNDARADVSEYIDRFDNRLRGHSKPGFVGPMEFEASAMPA